MKPPITPTMTTKNPIIEIMASGPFARVHKPI
jgi:hypothetical protein